MRKNLYLKFCRQYLTKYRKKQDFRGILYMDISFILMYIVLPIIISWGLITGKRTENHLRLTTVYAFKGGFYLYSAFANLFYYMKQAWAEKYVIGFVIGLAIIEGINGLSECYDESLKNVKECQKNDEICQLDAKSGRH